MITILSVDDEPALLDIGRIFLERSGEFRVITATSGREALSVIGSDTFDAVVSDYQMPGMDGIAPLKEIRARSPDLPYILFTGKGREEVVIEAIDNGADFYVQKGGDPKAQFVELEHKIRQAIRRRRSEEDLKKSEERFRSLIQNATDIITILDAEGAIIYSSPSFFRLLGFPTGSELGRPAMEFIHPGDREAVGRDLQDVYLRKNRMIPTQHRILTAGGGFICAESVGANMLDIPGVNGVVITSRDTTARIKKETELKAACDLLAASEEKLRQNLEQLVKSQEEVRILAQFPARNPHPVMRVGNGGVLRYANPAADRILHAWGISQGDVVPAFLRERVDETIRDGAPIQFSATIDGAGYHVTAAAVPKEPVAHVYFLDITDRKRAEEAIERRNEEISAAYQQLSATDLELRDNYRLLVEKQRVIEENEEKYRNLFEAESDAIFLIDNTRGTILEANTAASLLYGYSHDNLLGKKNTDLSAEPEKTLAFIRETPIEFGRVVTVPLRWHRKQDGTVFPVEIAARFFSWQGRPSHIAAIRDITDRQKSDDDRRCRADHAVRYQKALVQLATSDTSTLRLALNRITETGSETLGVGRAGIWFMSAEADALVCRDQFIRSTGTHGSGQEMLLSAFPDYFSALQDNRAIVVPDVLADERVHRFMEVCKDACDVRSMLHVPVRSGKDIIGVLCFEETGRPHEWDIEGQDFAGALADYLAVVLEQARRRLLEKDLKKSEEKYRAVVDRANDGIAIVQGGAVVFSNPKAAAIFGYSPQEIIGTPFVERVSPADRALVQERYARRKAGENVPPVYEITMIDRTGRPVAVELNAGIIMFEGRPADLVYIRDISDRKRSEQAIRLANQKLNLLSSITRHDILNKLTIAIGYLELAKMTHDREKLEDFIRKIDATLQVMEEQIQFTRDYQDMGVKEPEWQDAAAVFIRAVSQLDCGSIAVENNLAGLSVFADPLLSKVLYNIIDNALRYGETVTHITAGYTVSGSGAVITIGDDGIGISVKDKGKIFDKGVGHHTGLGLFLVKEILSLTGIDIVETGFPGKGALFEIHVPEGKFRTGQ